MKRNLIIMFSMNKFPFKDAGSYRDYYFAKIYLQLGYKVILICNSSENSCIDGIQYININNNHHTGLKYHLHYAEMIRDFFIKLDVNNVFAFHIYDIPISGINYLKRLSKDKMINLVHDSVEWYSSCEFKLGIFDKSYILKNYLNRVLINKRFNVIAISKYLENYFGKKVNNIIRIPVLMEFCDYVIESNDDKINIVYAGNPGKKDSLKQLVLAIKDITENGVKNLALHIIGMDKNTFIKLTNDKINVNNNEDIIFYGKMDNQKVINLLKKSDVSVCIRDSKKRFAKAGFPTKVVEGMKCKCIILCNYSSDLKLYLKDMENSIIIDQLSKENIINALRKITILKKEYIEKMKENSFLSGKEYFDYNKYVTVMKEFINGFIYE